MAGSEQKTQIATELPPQVASALAAAQGAPPGQGGAPNPATGARTMIASAPQLPPGGTAWQVQLEVLALDGTPGESARLDVRWTLVDPAGKATETRRATLVEPLAEPGLAPWVAGQRTNLARLGAAIAARIRERATR